MKKTSQYINEGRGILACPVCGESLRSNAKTIKCYNGHSFDIARQGYINLLLSNRKKSSDPGDSKDMIAARRRFLSTELYSPIVEAICDLIEEYILGNDEVELRFVEVGCGEGYYIGKLEDFLSQKHSPSMLYGIDISKHAILAAAKRYKHITFAVDNASKPSLLDKSVDVFLSIFAPFYVENSLKKLKSRGFIIQVVPTKNHLKELKQIIYEEAIVGNKTANNLELPSKIHLHKKNLIRETITLNKNSTIQDLFLMTPHYWRTKRDLKVQLEELDRMTVTLEVEVRLYAKAT